MKNKMNSFVVGLICGLTTPALAFIVYSKIKFRHETLITVMQHIKELGITSNIISLAVFVNLPLFFTFLWTHRDLSARGVLGATFLYAFAVAVLTINS